MMGVLNRKRQSERAQKESINNPFGRKSAFGDLLFDRGADAGDVLARDALGFVGLVAFDRLYDLRVLVADGFVISAGGQHRAKDVIGLSEAHQHNVLRDEDDAMMEKAID